MKDKFIYFLEAFYCTFLLSEKIISLVQILIEIDHQNLAKIIKLLLKVK